MAKFALPRLRRPRIADLIERIPALESPSELPESEASPTPTDTPAEPTEGPQMGTERRWWRRIFAR
jgi:hypothetical protein